MRSEVATPTTEKSNQPAIDDPIAWYFVKQISVTAYHSAEWDEYWCIARLWAVLGYVAGRPGIGNTALRCLASVHDHKGNLNITWRREPDTAWVKAFRDAWNEFEGGDSVEHLVVEVLLSTQPVFPELIEEPAQEPQAQVRGELPPF